MSFLQRRGFVVRLPCTAESNRYATAEAAHQSAFGARLTAILLVIASIPALAAAQPERDAAAKNTARERSSAAKAGLFLAGAGAALATHESGHLVFDYLFDAKPHLKAVDFHGLPFFAIAHRSGLARRKEFLISSAGFSVQHAENEWLLSRRPNLRREPAPIAKGMLTFNVLTSLAYAGAAFARTGPYERDTRGMAEAARLDERTIGVVVLVPALLDAWRYFHPDSKWAAWASRGAKAGMVLLVVR
jgi:hypothetical protein